MESSVATTLIRYGPSRLPSSTAIGCKQPRKGTTTLRGLHSGLWLKSRTDWDFQIIFRGRWVSSQSFHRLHLLHTLGQFQLLLLGPVFPAMDAWTKQMRKTEKPWSRFKSRYALRIIIVAKTCNHRRFEALSCSILLAWFSVAMKTHPFSKVPSSEELGGAWQALPGACISGIVAFYPTQ